MLMMSEISKSHGVRVCIIGKAATSELFPSFSAASSWRRFRAQWRLCFRGSEKAGPQQETEKPLVAIWKMILSNK